MRPLLVAAFTVVSGSAFAGVPLGVPAPALGAFGPLGLAAAAVGYVGWRLIKKRRGV